MSENPYLQSRRLWNDIYGSVERKLKLTQYVNIGLIFILLLFCGLLFELTHKSTIKPIPYVIHGNDIITNLMQDGHEHEELQPKLMMFIARSFIKDMRSHSVDPNVDRQQHRAAFAFVSQAAITKLKHDFRISHSKNIVYVHITSVLEQARKHFTIRWQEYTYENQVKTVRPYIAELTFEVSEPTSNQRILKHNPFGIYISHYDMSLDQEKESK